MNSTTDLRLLFNSGLKFRMHTQGVIIEDKIMVSRSKSRWKKLGSWDWHSYYGFSNLLNALIEDRLDQYAEQQDLQNTRQKLAVPVNNSRTRKTIYQKEEA